MTRDKETCPGCRLPVGWGYEPVLAGTDTCPVPILNHHGIGAGQEKAACLERQLTNEKAAHEYTERMRGAWKRSALHERADRIRVQLQQERAIVRRNNSIKWLREQQEKAEVDRDYWKARANTVAGERHAVESELEKAEARLEHAHQVIRTKFECDGSVSGVEPCGECLACQLTRAEAERDAALAANAAKDKLLREYMWVRYFDPEDGDLVNVRCAECGYYQEDGHAPDCELAAALSSEAGKGWVSPEKAVDAATTAHGDEQRHTLEDVLKWANAALHENEGNYVEAWQDLLNEVRSLLGKPTTASPPEYVMIAPGRLAAKDAEIERLERALDLCSVDNQQYATANAEYGAEIERLRESITKALATRTWAGRICKQCLGVEGRADLLYEMLRAALNPSEQSADWQETKVNLDANRQSGERELFPEYPETGPDPLPDRELPPQPLKGDDDED